MVGIFLGLMLISEIALAVYCFIKKKPARFEARILWLVQAAAIGAYFIFSPHDSTFQWYAILIWMSVLIIWGIFSLIKLLRKSDDSPYKKGNVICRAIIRCMIWFAVSVPLLIFPPHDQLETTGSYTVSKKVYTWTDESRKETLADTDEYRNVTVTFYYPQETDEKCPLILFSHGAFGFEKSNYSAYTELASNGYVVCSISHTYHAFYTEEADGTIKIVNMGFMQEALDATNGLYDNRELYELEQKWMDVRLADADFVLDTIIENCGRGDDEFFDMIDLEHIGMFGHSMGGATSVEMARKREEIDAVVVLDGTFIGSFMGYENGELIFNDEEINTPILNLRSEAQNENFTMGNEYINNYVLARTEIAKDTVIEGSEHMNFTDLPMFSPLLADMLGTGERDSRECIEIVNSLVKEWFDCYVKEEGQRTPRIKNKY